MKTEALPEVGQMAFARDCETIVTYEDVLNLLPEQFDIEDVQKALEELDVPYWPEEIQSRFISSWNYYGTPTHFIIHAEAIGLIRRVYDREVKTKYDEAGLFIGFERRE